MTKKNTNNNIYNKREYKQIKNNKHDTQQTHTNTQATTQTKTTNE